LCARCTDGHHQCGVCGTERGAEEREERKRKQEEIGYLIGNVGDKKEGRKVYRICTGSERPLLKT
jgi:hypothetical protein